MNKITINGVTIEVEGTNVTIRNGRVTMDGKEVSTGLSGIVEINWKGDLANLETDASVNCDNVSGNVSAGGSVNCDDVGGNVSAGGSINCEDVRGNASAGGSILHA